MIWGKITGHDFLERPKVEVRDRFLSNGPGFEAIGPWAPCMLLQPNQLYLHLFTGLAKRR